MRRILVSGASGIVGYGILRSLRQSKQPCFLVGTSIYEDSVAPAFCDVFEPLPPTNSPSFLSFMLSVLHRHSLHMLIPPIALDLSYSLALFSQIPLPGPSPSPLPPLPIPLSHP